MVAGDDGRVRLFSDDLSRTFWERRLNHGVYASVIADREHGRMIAVSRSGMVCSINLRGQVSWVATLNVAVLGTPALDESGRLLGVSTFAPSFVGIDAQNGEIAFVTTLNESWAAQGGGPVARREAYASPVKVEGGGWIVNCGETVHRINEDGRKIWVNSWGVGVKASPATYGDRAVICGTNGVVYCLNANDGVVTDSLPGMTRICASPAVSNGLFAVGDSRGTLLGFGIDPLRELWRIDGMGPKEYTSVATLPNGDFVCTTVRGTVGAVSRNTGRFLWETNQITDLEGYLPELDVTPVAGSDGNLYCTSYDGNVARFRFRQSVDRAEAI
jgi:outer membrane protein assembly factor BamB